jgi:hypothetical protein
MSFIVVSDMAVQVGDPDYSSQTMHPTERCLSVCFMISYEAQSSINNALLNLPMWRPPRWEFCASSLGQKNNLINYAEGSSEGKVTAQTPQTPAQKRVCVVRLRKNSLTHTKKNTIL